MVVVNGTDDGEAYPAHAGADGALVMSRADLIALGVPVPSGRNADVRLDALPGVQVAFDPARQVLRLDFAIHDRRRNRVELTTTTDEGPITASTTGFLVNYDVVANRDRVATSAGGLFEGRLFADIGTLSTTASRTRGGSPGRRTSSGSTRPSPRQTPRGCAATPPAT